MVCVLVPFYNVLKRHATKRHVTRRDEAKRAAMASAKVIALFFDMALQKALLAKRDSNFQLR